MSNSLLYALLFLSNRHTSSCVYMNYHHLPREVLPSSVRVPRWTLTFREVIHDSLLIIFSAENETETNLRADSQKLMLPKVPHCKIMVHWVIPLDLVELTFQRRAVQRRMWHRWWWPSYQERDHRSSQTRSERTYWKQERMKILTHLLTSMCSCWTKLYNEGDLLSISMESIS